MDEKQSNEIELEGDPLAHLTPEQRVIAQQYLALNRHGKRAAKSLARKRAKKEQRAAALKAARGSK